jgi:hypothetical protein
VCKTIDNFSELTMIKRLITTVLFSIYLNSFVFGTDFVIESIRVGPNPLLKSSGSLIINYVASTSHSANYYLYTVTGELIFQESYDSNLPGITNAGECQFELINNSLIQSFQKQLYVLYIELDNGTSSEQIKKYVIIK